MMALALLPLPLVALDRSLAGHNERAAGIDINAVEMPQ